MKERNQIHYELERKLAQRILRSSAEERTRVVADCYDELYRSIPWHPGVQPEINDSNRGLRSIVALYRGLVRPRARVLEVGCGQGKLATSLASLNPSAMVIGTDISIVKIAGSALELVPPNVTFAMAEGTKLPFSDESFDLVVSSQVMEHFHPADVKGHFSEVMRVLRHGGVYAFDTPNRVTGPHDISRGFTDVATGFHLKEWTYAELTAVAFEAGAAAVFSNIPVWATITRRLGVPGSSIPCPVSWKIVSERFVSSIQSTYLRTWSGRVLGVTGLFLMVRSA